MTTGALEICREHGVEIQYKYGRRGINGASSPSRKVELSWFCFRPGSDVVGEDVATHRKHLEYIVFFYIFAYIDSSLVLEHVIVYRPAEFGR
jgi:hypothetical protein